MSMKDIGIGEKVRKYKKERGMSSRTLAELADISSSMVTQIEKSQANPSITTLKSIAQALDVPLYRFFLNDDLNGDSLEVSPVVKKSDRKVMSILEDEGIRYELLVPGDKIEFCMLYLSPSRATSDKLFDHSGEEVACVISGEATILFDDVIYTLEEGDSIRIPAHTKHRWMNPIESMTVIVFAISPPVF